MSRPEPEKALRAKRRRLFRNLLAAGMAEPQARRVANAVHAPGAAAKRAKSKMDPAAAGIWIPPKVHDDLRAQLLPVDRLAKRLMETLRMTSERARQMAEQSFRRVDVKADVKEKVPA
jgi:hypothetical protein